MLKMLRNTVKMYSLNKVYLKKTMYIVYHVNFKDHFGMLYALKASRDIKKT